MLHHPSSPLGGAERFSLLRELVHFWLGDGAGSDALAAAEALVDWEAFGECVRVRVRVAVDRPTGGGRRLHGREGSYV